MLLQSSVAALAFASLATAGYPGNPKDFCCAVTSAITRFHEQAAATSFCSAYLSIKPKTTTTQKTVTTSVSKPSVTRTTKTVTPTSTISATLTTTITAGIQAGLTTVPTFVTVTATRTVTALSTTTLGQTSTATVTAAITSVSTSTAITTTTSFATTTTSELDSDFKCFTTSTPRPKGRRGMAERIPALRFVQGIIPKKITSACNCLSLTTPTKGVTATTTISRTAASPTTTTATVTAPLASVTVTSTQKVTVPAATFISTAFSTGTATTTTTVTVTSILTVTSLSVATTTVSATSISITTTFATATTTSTTTVTASLNTDFRFRIATNEGAASSGQELVAAAGVSSPPYNFFYWRTQHSGVTTFHLDDDCQLLEDFAGVYAQMKPSDPNPGIVFSGSGVPVTCEVDIGTDDIRCSNPAGGDTSYLCSTSFGPNTYPLWWLGENRSPGSRCEEHNMRVKAI